MIYGKRMRLRALEKEDLHLYVEWVNDPDVRGGVAMYLPFSMYEEEKWYESTMAKPAAEHPMMIEVKEGDSWMPIGDCGFFTLDHRNRSGELGILIGRKDYWNQGYGSEAVQLLLEHGFNTLNLHRVYLRVFEDNKRAIRAYEKCGFIHEGHLRSAEYKDGKYVDVLFMSVLKEEWNNDR
ncbi:MAG: GNAT family N-acetyltransferase [Anaerolineales bacterium]|nr:GNAT family N-acetyltransferase [Anaerolineales bacterium]